VLALQPLARTCHDHLDRPPAVFVSALRRSAESWRIDRAELKRAEWFWRQRPEAWLFKLIERRPFLMLAGFTLATLSLVAFVHVLVWAACFAVYPVYVHVETRRRLRWERCYAQALRRIARVG
jgi:hypothetical protein